MRMIIKEIRNIYIESVTTMLRYFSAVIINLVHCQLFKFITVFCFSIVLYSSLFAQPEGSALHYYRLGNQALQSNNSREALENYRQALELNPGYGPAARGAGNASYSLREYREAENYYRTAIRLEEDLAAKTGLGRSLSALGNLQEALSVLQEVSAVRPDDPDNNVALGEHYARAGRSSIARQYYNRVLNLQPAFMDALLGLAELEIEDNRIDIASRLLERASSYRPNDDRLHSLQGRLRLKRAMVEASSPEEQRRHIQEARRYFEMALDRAGQDSEIEKELIRIYILSGDTGRARTIADNLIRREPENLEYRILMADLLEIDGNNQVREHLQQALSLDPSNSLIRIRLEESIINDISHPAESPLRRNLASFHRQIAEHYGRMNLHNRRRQHIRRNLQLRPHDQRALEDVLDTYRRAGDYERFLETLQALRDNSPNDPRLQHRLEEALRRSRGHLAYRENLLTRDPIRASVERNSNRVFIFDFQPAYTFHPHRFSGRDAASLLAHEIRERGRILPVDAGTRRQIMSRIRRSDNISANHPVYYRAGYSSFLTNTDLKAAISGNFRQDGDRLRFEFNIQDLSSGRRLDRFTLQADGNDAIYQIMDSAARRIKALFPLQGNIVRSSARGIYLNIGSHDGLVTDQRLEVKRAGRTIGYLQAQEVTPYVSSARPEGDFTWTDYFEGDTVLALD